PCSISRGVNEHIMPIGANMAVRRETLRRLGGLHTDLGKLAGSLQTGEDHELFLRMLEAGCRGVYQPAAIVHHLVPKERLEPRYLGSGMYQNGRAAARVERLFPPRAVKLFGIPRYLWRRAAVDAWTFIQASATANAPDRFRAVGGVLWTAGYLRESY